LKVINEETDRLTSLVNDILEISQLEHGTMKIVRESVDVAPLVKRILCESKPVADNKNIVLECAVGADLPSVLGDEKKIQSAMSNLVSNAIKFTPEGGKVRVCGRQQGEELVLQVSDTGVGIPKEELPKVFERFYRVHRPGQQIQGTGLGLAIVKEVISMHGGRVEVESEPGKGTTFTVSLALAAEPSAPDSVSGCSSSLMVEAAGAPPEQADHTH
jgi:two-component system phosphate regulon sensor histidine kinase PhoR